MKTASGSACGSAAGEGSALEVAGRLVGEVADGAAVEARQAGQRHDAEASQLLLDLQQGVGLRCAVGLRAGRDRAPCR